MEVRRSVASEHGRCPGRRCRRCTWRALHGRLNAAAVERERQRAATMLVGAGKMHRPVARVIAAQTTLHVLQRENRTGSIPV